MDTAPELKAMKDSRLVVMELMVQKVRKVPGRGEEAEKALTRSLNVPKADAVKAIPGQNICKSESLGEQQRVTMFLTNAARS